MKIVCVGAGPGGLFLAILLAKAKHEVLVLERHKPDDSFGFGVAFSDATLEKIRGADPETHTAISRNFLHWDGIEVFYRDTLTKSRGHGFAGLGRHALLSILRQRAISVGVNLRFDFQLQSVDVDGLMQADLVVGADGPNSVVRARFADAFAPQIDFRPNRFVWLGTSRPLSAFTFYCDENEHGPWVAYAYPFTNRKPLSGPQSSFIVESSAATFARAGLDPADEAATLAYCEKLFAHRLGPHGLFGNRSLWRNFPAIRCDKWHHNQVVLLGDAAHTTHFSIGSGTKLAMEDAIALEQALVRHSGDWPTALLAYEQERRRVVEAKQQIALESLLWFEQTELRRFLEPWQFSFSLLTRSQRVNHETLRGRDPELIAQVNDQVALGAENQARVSLPRPAPPPMFTPFRLRSVVLPNRVVLSPMCQYMAEDGMPNDWHLIHLGSRAVGGAGLLLTEMTAVCREGRITPACAGLYKPEHVPAWRRIVDFVHHQTEAKIGVQLGHAGRKAARSVPWVNQGAPLSEQESWPIVGPSPVPWDERSQIPREMTAHDFEAVLADFVSATEMAALAGFDWLELHMAHGYLLASFLSPLTNLRSDEFGGGLTNRLRFPLAVFSAVRAAWPEEKPISVRISAHDWAPGGLLPAQAVQIAQGFQSAGADAIDVSSGGTVPESRPPACPLYQVPFSEQIRLKAGVPTMAVGQITSFAEINSIVAAGRADLACLARTLLEDPYFCRHAALQQSHPPAVLPPRRANESNAPR